MFPSFICHTAWGVPPASRRFDGVSTSGNPTAPFGLVINANVELFRFLKSFYFLSSRPNADLRNAWLPEFSLHFVGDFSRHQHSSTHEMFENEKPASTDSVRGALHLIRSKRLRACFRNPQTRSRRRKEAETRPFSGKNPPPYVGGYSFKTRSQLCINQT